MSNNLPAKRWTDDSAQQEQFFTAVGPRIHGESKYMAWVYCVGTYLEDIESEVKAKLWRQMLEIDTGGPFAKDSPEEAADFFLEKKNYRIREWARLSARKEADKHKQQSRQADILADVRQPEKQSRQADILANVRQPDLPPDFETELFTIAKSLPRIFSKTPDLTSRESEILLLETLRLSEVDDLPAPIFDQVAQAAGTSGPKQRAHNEYHDEHGHLSPSDRKALSRARAKVAKVLTRAALTSLLVIVFTLSVASLNAIPQGRSIHKNDFVNQFSLSDEIVLGHQDKLSNEVARDHQFSLSDEIARDHQFNVSDEIARDHQLNVSDEIARDHQFSLSDEIVLGHQDKLSNEVARDHQFSLSDEIARDHQDTLI